MVFLGYGKYWRSDAIVGLTPIEGGRGILDSKSILAALLKIKYRGLVGFEYEKDAKDPVPGPAESAGYIKGLLAAMK